MAIRLIFANPYTISSSDEPNYLQIKVRDEDWFKRESDEVSIEAGLTLLTKLKQQMS